MKRPTLDAFAQTYLYCPVAVDYSPRKKRRHSGRGSAECGADCNSAHNSRVAPNDGQLGTRVKPIPPEPQEEGSQDNESAAVPTDLQGLAALVEPARGGRRKWVRLGSEEAKRPETWERCRLLSNQTDRIGDAKSHQTGYLKVRTETCSSIRRIPNEG